jgi:peptide/nickel transport system substrate-binding protein
VARDENGEEILEWWSPQNGGASAGPFKMVEYDFDQGHVAFEPNENWWGPKPKLSRIELNIVEDPNVAVQLIKNGEYNASIELFTTTAVDDLGKEFFRGHLIPAGMHFWFNVNNKPLDDVNVRKALIMAVDRAGMCQASIPQGPDIRVESLLIAVPGADDPKFEPFPYDPEGAKAALAASSYGGPDNLPKLILGRMRNPVQQAAAQFIVEQWRQNLGITASEIRADMPDESIAHVLRDDAGTRVPDAAAFLMGTIHSSAGAARGLMGGYKNADVDAKLESASTKLVEDPDRIALAQEAQRLFRDDWAFIPWYGQVMPRWATANVEAMDRNLDWNVVEPWNIEIT